MRAVFRHTAFCVASCLGLGVTWLVASPQTIKHGNVLDMIRGANSCDCITTSLNDCNTGELCEQSWWKCVDDPELNNKYCGEKKDENGVTIMACEGITCSGARPEQECGNGINDPGGTTPGNTCNGQ